MCTSPVLLGFYLLAFNLSAWPVNVFSAPARRVSLPAFARLHAGETGATAAFVPACTALITVTLPACLLLAVFAGPLVHVVYGVKWAPAGRVMPWLMAMALVRVLGELAYDFLVALDRPHATLVVQGLWLLAVTPALIVGTRVRGIEGAAMAHTIVALLVAAPAYGYFLRRCGVNLRDVAADLARPVAGSLLALALAFAALWVVPDQDAPGLGDGVERPDWRTSRAGGRCAAAS